MSVLNHPEATVQAVEAEGSSGSSAPPAAKKVMGMISKEDYEKNANRLHEEWDPERGTWRLIRGDGEIVERCVSKQAQEALRRMATKNSGWAGDRANYTGKEAWPSQNPFYGYK